MIIRISQINIKPQKSVFLRFFFCECVKVFLKIRYPKIIDELYGGKITVVQLVLTIPNPIDFVKNHDKICI